MVEETWISTWGSFHERLRDRARRILRRHTRSGDRPDDRHLRRLRQPPRRPGSGQHLPHCRARAAGRHLLLPHCRARAPDRRLLLPRRLDGGVTGPHVGFKRHLRAEVVPGDAVYVFSEEDTTALRGPHLEELVPLLDGTRGL